MKLWRRLHTWLADEAGKGVVKGIGRIIGTPIKGIGHALATSGIPLVSNVGGIAEKAGKGFTGELPFLKSVAPAALTALGGAGLLGAGPLSGVLGGVGKLGGGLLKSGVAKLGVGKLLSGGGGAGAGGGTMAEAFPGAGYQVPTYQGDAPIATPGDTGGILGKVMSYIGKNPLEAAQLGLAGLNTVQANKLKGQQFGLMNEAMGRVNKAANANVPGFDPYAQLPGVQARVGARP